MASLKRKPVDSARKKINEKITEIKDVSSRLHNTINDVVNKPLDSGTVLLNEKSNKKFLNSYTKVNQELESCLCQLLLLETALTNDGEAGDEETDGDDEEEDEIDVGNIDTGQNDIEPLQEGLIDNEEEEIEEIDATQANMREKLTPSSVDTFTMDIDLTSIDLIPQQSIVDTLNKNSNFDIEHVECADKIEQDDSAQLDDEIYSSESSSIQAIEAEPLIHSSVLPSLDDLLTVIDDKSKIYNQIQKDQGIEKRKNNIDDKYDTVSERHARPSITSSSKASSQITSKKLHSKPLKRGLILQTCPIIFGKQYAVVVGEILSPSKIYIQLINDDYNQFMEDMCIEFAKEASAGYRGGVSEVPSVGQTCCAKSPVDDTWYRAIVTDVHLGAAAKERDDTFQAGDCQGSSVSSIDDTQLNPSMVDVLFVDQGSFAQSLPLTMLRPLPTTMFPDALLPRQALCCSLGGIQPVGCEFDANDVSMGVIHRQWSSEATQWLIDLLQSEEILKAVFTPIKTKSDNTNNAIFVDLYLCDMASPSAAVCDELSVALMMKQIEMADTYPTPPCSSHSDSPLNEESKTMNQVQSPTEEEHHVVDSQRQKNDCTSPVGASYKWMGMLLDNGKSTGAFTFTNNYELKDWSHLSRDFGKVVVSHVIDPSRFYVHLLTVDLIDFDSFVDRLNAFYDSKGSHGVDKKHLSVQEGYAVVAKCTEDKRWCRGLITTIKRASRASRTKPRSCCVLFVDYGTEEWLPEDSLLPVQNSFFDFPIQTSCCCLADIEPCVPESDDLKSNGLALGRAEYTGNNSVWLLDVIQKFKDIVLTGKPLVVSLIKKASDSMTVPTNVYVYDTTDDKEICINQLLVDRGMASSKVLTKLSTPVYAHAQDEIIAEEIDASTPDSPSGNGQWDPMKAEFESERNRYNLNVDDASIAAGSMVLSNKRICRFYATRQGCYRGADCQFDHCRPEEIPVQEIEVFCSKTINGIDLPDEGTWVAVTVTSFFDISHFWVQFPLGTQPLQNIIFKGVPDDDNSKELDILHEQMRSAYEGKRFENNSGVSLPALGELLAARFSKDGLWYRARVIDISNETQYKVFFIDYGNCETVKAADTRLLLRNFVHLDAQAVECFLAGIQPLANQSTTPVTARKRFEQLTADKVLVARIKARYPNSVLFLELFETVGDTSRNIAHLLADEGLVTLASEDITTT